MNLTTEEERLLREESEEGGFEAFKRGVDRLETRRRGASPKKYAEHHRRKEMDMR